MFASTTKCETAHKEDMARYSKEQTDAVIDAAVEALGLESLKHQQREAIIVYTL